MRVALETILNEMIKATRVLVLFLGVLAGQSAVPVGEEPRHHVKFTNKFVRVIEAVLPPGDTTLFHIHAQDNVPVAISGGKVRTELMGGQPVESIVETGSARFAIGSYTHRVGNAGATTLRFIDVEILASPGSPATARSLDGVAGHTVILDNERVRIYRLVLGPGAESMMHTHDLAGLTVVVAGGAVTNSLPATLASAGAAPLQSKERFRPGDFSWREAGYTHSVKNLEDTAVELVEIEWK